MICVKYNRRCNFLDEDLWNATDSTSKHFANDLATHAETQIFPFKYKHKIRSQHVKIGSSSDCVNFLPIFGS